MLWALWPIWALLAPLCILATIAAISISPIIFPPGLTLLLLGVSTLAFAIGIFLTALFEDDRIALAREHISLPLLLAPTLWLRRQLSWSDLSQADLSSSPDGADNSASNLKLCFLSAAAVKIDLKSISKLEQEQLLMAIEFWSKPNTMTEQLVEFHRQLQNENKGIEKVSYTRLWEDELSRRFRTTTFVPLEPGAILHSGSLIISRQLAFGGLSAIYLAKRDGKDFVVLKEVNLPANAEPALKQKAEQLFQREAQLLMKLAHKQIAQVLDHFVEGGRSYLLLEYVNGQDLRQFVQQHGRQSESIVLTWAIQIAAILDYLHSQPVPIIHRDLTPDNLILHQDGTLVLIDFGAANEFIAEATSTIVGKQAYMPPEQLRGKTTIKSDYYAFGATLYFLLTGDDPPALSVLHPGEKVAIAKHLDEFVALITELNPDDRLGSHGGTLSQVLTEFAGAPALPSSQSASSQFTPTQQPPETNG